MSNIILFAETGSDIPKDVAEKLGIYIIPMYVVFGDELKADGTFPAEEVISFYTNTGILPKTSATAPYEFSCFYDEIHAKDPDAKILYMAYSTVTTSTFRNGMIGVEDRDYIYGFDTKQVSAGQNIVVTLMAQYLKEHPDLTIEEAIAYAEVLRTKVHMSFTPDTLEYLRAGGRVSNAAALVGGLLKIHPVIEIIDGYLKATRKLRGTMKKIAPMLVRESMQAYDIDKKQVWLIYSPGLSDEIREAAEQTALDLGAEHVSWIKTGGVITCHSGPNAFGIVVLEK